MGAGRWKARRDRWHRHLGGPAGIVGARLYHVITDYELYQHDLLGAFAIWDGGLGLAGGIAAMEGMRIDFAQIIGIDALPQEQTHGQENEEHQRHAQNQRQNA